MFPTLESALDAKCKYTLGAKVRTKLAGDEIECTVLSQEFKRTADGYTLKSRVAPADGGLPFLADAKELVLIANPEDDRVEWID